MIGQAVSSYGWGVECWRLMLDLGSLCLQETRSLGAERPSYSQCPRCFEVRGKESWSVLSLPLTAVKQKAAFQLRTRGSFTKEAWRSMHVPGTHFGAAKRSHGFCRVAADISTGRGAKANLLRNFPRGVTISASRFPNTCIAPIVSGVFVSSRGTMKDEGKL